MLTLMFLCPIMYWIVKAKHSQHRYSVRKLMAVPGDIFFFYCLISEELHSRLFLSSLVVMSMCNCDNPEHTAPFQRIVKLTTDFCRGKLTLI